MPSSKTIVRKVRGGSDPSAHRFVILSETWTAERAFVFIPQGVEMTTAETCHALIAHGISETDATALIDEAIEAFYRP